jgi:hypothetical protein
MLQHKSFGDVGNDVFDTFQMRLFFPHKWMIFGDVTPVDGHKRRSYTPKIPQFLNLVEEIGNSTPHKASEALLKYFIFRRKHYEKEVKS